MQKYLDGPLFLFRLDKGLGEVAHDKPKLPIGGVVCVYTCQLNITVAASHYSLYNTYYYYFSNSENYMIRPKDSVANEEGMDDADSNKILQTEQFVTENEVILQICNTFDAFIQGIVSHFESKKEEKNFKIQNY